MHYIGIDIGGTAIKLAVVDSSGKIVKKSRMVTGATRSADEVIKELCSVVKELAKGENIQGIGIGCPGAIDSSAGVVKYSNNLYWKDVPLAKTITDETGFPCFVSNDANVAALGEVKFGAGKNYSDAIMITLGTGVGTGIVVGGKVFEGFASLGAEGGHIVIRDGGVLCTCGRRGCLEVYGSATALIRETLHAMNIDKNSLMWAECGNDLNNVKGETSFFAAKKGDKTALEVVDNYAKALAVGAANFVNIFASEAIIFGGGVSAQGAYLNDKVQAYVDEYKYGGKIGAKTKILTASLGNDAGIYGAACLCMEKLGQ